MRRVLSVVLVLAMVTTLAAPVLAESAATPLAMLNSAETLLYGKEQLGSLVERLDRLEMDLFGETKKSDPLLVRIDAVSVYAAEGGLSGQSIHMQLNAAEWMIYQKLTSGLSVIDRLKMLETGLYGTPQKGPIVKRVEELVRLVWPSGKLNTKMVDIPKETLVKIRLLDGVDSGTAEKGNKLRYRVVEDVIVNGAIIIPSGAEGTALVSEVQKAGRLGRDGKLSIDFRDIKAMDGTQVKLGVAEKATEKNKSLELAAGASMAGVILLGPIGLAGAFFVKGKDVNIQAGTEFYVETTQAVRLNGLLLSTQT